MTDRRLPSLTPAKLRKRINEILDLWKERGLEVGGLVVEGDRIVVLTPDGAQKELDPFEQWERDNAA